MATVRIAGLDAAAVVGALAVGVAVTVPRRLLGVAGAAAEGMAPVGPGQGKVATRTRQFFHCKS